MKAQRLYPGPAVEVTGPGLEVTAELAASGMDMAISELFRLAPDDGAVSKGIVPYGVFAASGTSPQSAGIVTSSGVADRALYIYPFRALIGAIPIASSPETAWTRTRTVAIVRPTALLNLQEVIQLSTTDGSHSRCDLIWVKVTLAATTESEVRYTRDPVTGVISTPTIVNQISDTYTLGVTEGVPFAGTTPARPALPADSGTDFYIPLAYVFIPSSFGATTVANKWIQEVAPVIPIARATGATSIRPATWQNTAGSPILSVDDFNTATGGHRGIGYLPSTFVGGEQLIITCSWNTTGPLNIPALNGVRIVDTSVDWRRRLFKVMLMTSAAASALPWDGGGPISGGAFDIGYGQSFRDDGTGGIGTAGGLVAKQIGGVGQLDHAIDLLVDLSTGNLKMKVPAASPNRDVIIWLEATGQYANSS